MFKLNSNQTNIIRLKSNQIFHPANLLIIFRKPWGDAVNAELGARVLCTQTSEH